MKYCLYVCMCAYVYVCFFQQSVFFFLFKLRWQNQLCFIQLAQVSLWEKGNKKLEAVLFCNNYVKSGNNSDLREILLLNKAHVVNNLVLCDKEEKKLKIIWRLSAWETEWVLRTLTSQ